MTDTNQTQLTKICFGSFWVDVPLNANNSGTNHLLTSMESSAEIKSNEVDATNPEVKCVLPVLKGTETNMLAAVNAQEIEVP
jgi:hypothetical protein